MRLKIISAIIFAVAAAAAFAQGTYESTAQRAARSFKWEEWNSAAAMYELMLKERPDSLSTYARAIAANQMLGDTAATVDLVERAMSHGIGLSEVLKAVRHTDFSIGQGDLYGGYLHLLWNAMPWMRRALDNELLEYYSFRNDGPMMVRYAGVMLAGLPDSVEYLALLARGQMLSGDMNAAATTWRKILDLDTDNYSALIMLGNYLVLKGSEEGNTLLARANALRPTPYVTRELQ